MDDVAFYACLSTLSAGILTALVLKKRQCRRRRRVWVRPWIERRGVKGIHENLIKEIVTEDQKSYINYLRMDSNTFEYILSKVSPFIKRQDTHLRNSISVQDRLMVTLRFLATGESYTSLQYSTRIPQCTISKIVPETCEAIYTSLKDEVLKVRKNTIYFLTK